MAPFDSEYVTLTRTLIENDSDFPIHSVRPWIPDSLAQEECDVQSFKHDG
jgi:hypothetical protein